MIDWSHQQALVRDAGRAYVAGHRRILIALATGGGKTRVGVTCASNHLSKRPTGRVLWTCHRRELLSQATDAIGRAGADMSRTIVESVQTLFARGVPADISFVVVDEFHHAVSATYRRVLAQLHPDVLLGLTATPSRLDGVALGSVADVIVAGPQPRALIHAGVLVPTRVFAPSGPRRTLAADPVDAYREHARGRKAIVFCASVGHASALALEFTMAGYPAASLDGKTRDRDGINSRFAAGELQILTTYRLVGEGYDVPDCACVILAGNTTSAAMLLQMDGRSKRSAPGKVDAISIDLVGAHAALDLHPDDDMTYSLEGQPIRAAGEVLEAIRQCPECGCYARVPEYEQRTCPYCGFVVPARPDPRVVKARVEERKREELARRVDRLVRTRDERAAFLAGGRGLRQFHHTFGRWPTAAERTAAERMR